MDIEQQKLVLDASGFTSEAKRAEVAAHTLDRRLAELRRDQDELTRKFASGAIGPREYAREMRRLGGDMEQTKRSLQEQRRAVVELTAAERDAMAAARALGAATSATGAAAGGLGSRLHPGGGGGAGNLGLGLLMFSQLLEDSEYGMRAILNNIPGLVLAFGGGPGLAGAVSIAAVAMNRLSEGTSELIDLPLLGRLQAWRDTVNVVEGARQAVVGFFSGKDEAERRDEDRARQRSDEREAKRQARLKESLDSVVGIATQGVPEIGAAIDQALARAGGGKSVVDTIYDAWVGRQDDPGLTNGSDRARQTKERMQKHIADLIRQAREGNRAALNVLLSDPQMGGFAAGQLDFGTKLLDALAPAREDVFRRKATEYFTKFARVFNQVANAGDFTVPDLTAKGRGKMGAELQQRLEALGIDPRTQEAIAEALGGKDSKQRLAELSRVLPMLQAGGASEREIFEAIPRLVGAGREGRNPFGTAQGLLNELARGGLAADLQGAGRSRQQMDAEAALGFLGLTPDQDPAHASRFGRPRDLGMSRAEGRLTHNRRMRAADDRRRRGDHAIAAERAALLGLPDLPPFDPGPPEGRHGEEDWWGPRQQKPSGGGGAAPMGKVIDGVQRAQEGLAANQAQFNRRLARQEAINRNVQAVGQETQQQGRTAQNRGR